MYIIASHDVHIDVLKWLCRNKFTFQSLYYSFILIENNKNNIVIMLINNIRYYKRDIIIILNLKLQKLMQATSFSKYLQQ